ncbi:MAG TPA: twin-arginine translocase TatA/TatE family subunit [Kribbella sp.]|jgi:sec-independent protein translocase protein TatA
MVPLLALPEGGEWIVLLVVVVFLFGANKLPDLTRNAARALVEFKKITNGKDDEPTVDAAGPAGRPAETPAKPEGGGTSRAD